MIERLPGAIRIFSHHAWRHISGSNTSHEAHASAIPSDIIYSVVSARPSPGFPARDMVPSGGAVERKNCRIAGKVFSATQFAGFGKLGEPDGSSMRDWGAAKLVIWTTVNGCR